MCLRYARSSKNDQVRISFASNEDVTLKSVQPLATEVNFLFLGNQRDSHYFSSMILVEVWCM